MIKNIKTIAIAVIFSLGIGGAVTAHLNDDPVPNVMNTKGILETPVWVPLTDSKGCNYNSERPCIGFRATPTSEVIVIQKGTKIL